MKADLSPPRLLRAAAIAVVAGVTSAQAATVNLPYANDFTSGEDFTVSDASEWNLDTSGSGAFTFSTASSSDSGLALLTANDIGGASPGNFVTRSTFTVTDVSGQSNADTWGMAVLGNSESSPGEYVLVDWSRNNLLRIINIGNGNGSVVNDTQTTTGDNVNFAVDQAYTMTITGAYTGTDLQLSVEISDGSNSSTLTAGSLIDTSLYYDGSAMGLRARSGASSGDPDEGTTVAYDSFSVIPEPSSLMLLGLGGLMVLRRQRC